MVNGFIVLGIMIFFSFIVTFNFEVCLLFFCSFVSIFYGFCLWILAGSIVFSGRIVMILVFWDFLRVNRFFLVLFYGNMIARSGSMSAAFTNRVGDFCVFLFFNGFILFFLICIFVSIKFTNKKSKKRGQSPNYENF